MDETSNSKLCDDNTLNIKLKQLYEKALTEEKKRV